MRTQMAPPDLTPIWQHGSMSQSGPGVALRADIQRSGYYPEIVGEALDTALGSEEVLGYVVHHEATFDRDELRRACTAGCLLCGGGQFEGHETERVRPVY